MRRTLAVIVTAVASFSSPAFASFHLWQVNEFYSNAAGNVQFVELTALAGGQQFLAGHTITSGNGATTHTYTFPTNLPGDTGGRRMLIGTQSFAAMGVVAPDYVVPDNFFFRGNFRINFAGADIWDNTSGAMMVPTGGLLSLARNGVTDTNSPLNFAGATATVFPLAINADVSGDGRSDVVWRNAQTGEVYRMAMSGGAIASQGMVYTEPDTSWVVVADADFNGDGRTDLLWRNLATGHVYLMPFNAAGEPEAGGIIYVEPDTNWRIVRTPDVDGDGKADILWWNGSTGQLYGMLMDGLSITMQGTVHFEPDTQWRVAGSGDFARMGHDQLVWHHNSSGLLYFMNVTVEAGAFRTTGTPVHMDNFSAWRIVGAADFDGDLHSDLLWRNNATGQVYVMLLGGFWIKGGGIVHTEPNPAWHIVAIGDYDGDFRNDLLWRNTSTGEVYLMRLNGASIASGAVIYTEPAASWHIMGVEEYAGGGAS